MASATTTRTRSSQPPRYPLTRPRTTPATSIPRWSPTLLLKWEMTGSRLNSGALRSTVASTGVAVLMSVPHTGIDQRGHDVHDEVGDGHDDGEEHHDALDRHEVAGRQVIGQLESQPLPLEGFFGQHRAAQHYCDLQAHHRDDGNQGRLIGV